MLVFIFVCINVYVYLCLKSERVTEHVYGTPILLKFIRHLHDLLLEVGRYPLHDVFLIILILAFSKR